MVNNYDRIYAEISKESEALGPDSGLDSDLLLDLVMAIVEIEHRNQTKKVHNINQLIREKILLVAQDKIRNEEGQ